MMDYQNADYGLTVQCRMYHPMARRFVSFRNNPAYHQRGILTISPEGREEFVACEDSKIHGLLYAPIGGRTLWRVGDPIEVDAKIAELAAECDDLPPGSAERIWGFREFVIPDEQQILALMPGRPTAGAGMGWR